MSDQTTIVAEKRQKLGSIETRKMRKAGMVPGNIYGHGQDPVPIKLPENVIRSFLFSPEKVAEVSIEGDKEYALLKDIQWDAFGNEILHFDLLRVDATETVEVEVRVDLHGVSPGTLAGGLLEQPLHELSVECSALRIPDAIVVNINELELDQSIQVSDVEVPAGVKITTPEDATIVQVVTPTEQPEEELAEGEEGPAEPEVIGRKDEDDNSGES